MKVDTLVIGGGPSGCFYAAQEAKKGKSVLVVEEHAEIGEPVHCTGILGVKSLEELGFSAKARYVANLLYGADLYSPSCNKIKIRKKEPVAAVVERKLFDKQVAKLAVEAGAEIWLKSRALELVENGSVLDVVVDNFGEEKMVEAEKIVIAEGAKNTFASKLGLVKERKLFVGMQMEMGGVDIADKKICDVYFGRKWAPGFFAWLVPLSEDTARVGLLAEEGKPAMDLLKKIRTEHPIASKRLEHASPIEVNSGIVTYTKLKTRDYKNLHFIGDTVSLNKPTTGGGIIYSFYDILGRDLSGELAAGKILRGILEKTPDAAMDLMFKLDWGWLAKLDFDFHHEALGKRMRDAGG